MAVGWPAVLVDGDVRLRPLRRRDQDAWMELRAHERRLAGAVGRDEPGARRRVRGRRSARSCARSPRRRARARRSRSRRPRRRARRAAHRLVDHLRVAAVGGDRLLGVASTSPVAASRPTAVALATDHCFRRSGLHRVEVNIRPENGPSLRVVEKLGFRDEGLRERFLHIQDRWCDHRTFALTVEDVPEGLLARWHAARAGSALRRGAQAGRHAATAPRHVGGSGAYRRCVNDLAGPVALALVGLWVAYLVPHKLRHRQQLLESRADDRFSEALRVVAVSDRRIAPGGRLRGVRADGEQYRGAADPGQGAPGGRPGARQEAPPWTDRTAPRTGSPPTPLAAPRRRAPRAPPPSPVAPPPRAVAPSWPASCSLATVAGWAAVGLVPAVTWVVGVVPDRPARRRPRPRSSRRPGRS